MPVEDHVVHEKVKIASDKPYGCNNRKSFSRGYWVKTRVYIDGDSGRYELIDVFLPHRMSAACRSFYLWGTDPRCATCTAKRDTEYADKMRGLE